MTKIFISYSSKDRPLVNHLAGEIEFAVEDASIWFDRELKNTGGQLWWDNILEQIRACEVFLYALTPQLLASKPCRLEFEYAQALGKPVLPVLLIDIDPRTLPKALMATQFVDYREGNREQMGYLRTSLRNLPAAPVLPTNALDLAPPVPLDPVGVALDSITQLTNDVNQQRLLLLDIEELADDAAYQASVPELLTRLMERDDVLNARNLKKAEALFARFQQIESTYVPKPRSIDLLTPPFAWIDIPGTSGKLWRGAPYRIAKYPVTNKQFEQFIVEHAYLEPRFWTEEGWAIRDYELWRWPLKWQDEQWNTPDQPVVGVSWFEAVAFCLWLSDTTGEKIMLPTKDQWEFAAQGDDERRYPWGNKWSASRCNNNLDQKGIGRTTPVQQYEGKGDSPFGVVDMAGNVWEWSLTDLEGANDVNREAEYRILRGGSWYNEDVMQFQCEMFFRDFPTSRQDHIGFRIVMLE